MADQDERRTLSVAAPRSRRCAADSRTRGSCARRLTGTPPTRALTAASPESRLDGGRLERFDHARREVDADDRIRRRRRIRRRARRAWPFAASHSRGSSPAASNRESTPFRVSSVARCQRPARVYDTTMRRSPAGAHDRGPEHPLRPAELRAAGRFRSSTGRTSLEIDRASTTRPDRSRSTADRPASSRAGRSIRPVRQRRAAGPPALLPRSHPRPRARSRPTASADGARRATPVAIRRD